MESHRVVSRDQWVDERKQFLAKEKEFTRLRDRLSQERRELPWVRVDKRYVFDGADGKETLTELFGGRAQLIVYHFMLDPDWEVGCKGCSFWADNFNGIDVHLGQRDVSFLAVSRAPWPRIEKFKTRMGWGFKWVSSFNSDFNFDLQVSFTPEEAASGKIYYNYSEINERTSEKPGVSVFYKGQDDSIYHTYSCYSRGIDLLNGAYNYLDLTPKGRDEAGLAHPMSWVRLHDEYGA